MNLFHETTQKNLERIIAHPPHAVLLVGANGAGKRAAADLIGQNILGSAPSKSQYFYEINATEGIEAIREAKLILSKTTTGKQTLRRLLLIENVDTLSHEAQNALLKTLEEPPADTVLLLTAADKTKVLTTIHSRVQLLHVQPITIKQLKDYAKQTGRNEQEAVSAYHMSGGLASLAVELLSEQDHPFKQAIKDAKQLLNMSAFEQLARADSFSRDKVQAATTATAFERIAAGGFAMAVEQSNETKTMYFHSLRKRSLRLQERIGLNANLKLALSEFFLS